MKHLILTFFLAITGIVHAQKVIVQTNGSTHHDTTIVVSTQGTGTLSTFISSNEANANPVMHLEQNGVGSVLRLRQLNGNSNERVVDAFTNGSGIALYGRSEFGTVAKFENNNVGNNSSVLVVNNKNGDTTAVINAKNVTGLKPAVAVFQAGEGRGIDINLTNSTNVEAGLRVTTAGVRAIEAVSQGIYGILSTTYANGATAIYGGTGQTANNAVAIRGNTGANVSNCIGVLGEAGVNDPNGIGVKGIAGGDEVGGIGVYGVANANTPKAIAVKGVAYTNAENAGAVTGINLGTLGESIGVYGESSNGNGIKAVSHSGFDAALYAVNDEGGFGVYAESEGADATALYVKVTPAGDLNSTAVRAVNIGQGESGFFTTSSTTNTGKSFIIENAGTGHTFWVDQDNASNANTMVAFQNDGTGNFLVCENGTGANKIRFDNTGKGFFNGGTQTGGADIAEAFDVEDDILHYEPGDVLSISTDKDRSVVKSSGPYSTLVAGVFATKPGVLMTEEHIDTDLSGKVPMGVVGVIPTKVCLEGGEIARGDLLVTSSIPGVAMKGNPDRIKPGQVLGKALENYSSSDVSKIRVLVNVQ